MIAGIVFNGVGISMAALALLGAIPLIAIAGLAVIVWRASSPPPEAAAPAAPAAPAGANAGRVRSQAPQFEPWPAEPAAKQPVARASATGG